MEANNRRKTKEQKLALVQYLEEHRDFAHDRFVNDSGCKSLAEQWTVVSDIVNGLAGASKSGEGWKKAWANIRSKAKQKAQELKAEMEKTGGGTICTTKKLTELDERIVGIMRKEAVFGYMVTDPMRASGVFPDVEVLLSENESECRMEYLEDTEIMCSEENALEPLCVPPERPEVDAVQSEAVRQIPKTPRLSRKRNLSVEESSSKLFELEEIKIKIMQEQLKEKRRKNDLAEKQLVLAEKQLQIDREKVAAINNFSSAVQKILQQNLNV